MPPLAKKAAIDAPQVVSATPTVHSGRLLSNLWRRQVNLGITHLDSLIKIGLSVVGGANCSQPPVMNGPARCLVPQNWQVEMFMIRIDFGIRPSRRVRNRRVFAPRIKRRAVIKDVGFREYVYFDICRFIYGNPRHKGPGSNINGGNERLTACLHVDALKRWRARENASVIRIHVPFALPNLKFNDFGLYRSLQFNKVKNRLWTEVVYANQLQRRPYGTSIF